jgi:hypothetical protein
MSAPLRVGMTGAGIISKRGTSGGMIARNLWCERPVLTDCCRCITR